MSQCKCRKQFSREKTSTFNSFLFCFLCLNISELTIGILTSRGFPSGASSKELTCNAGDRRDKGSIPRLRRKFGSSFLDQEDPLEIPLRSLGEGHGSTLQHSFLENSMDRGAWRAMVHGVTESGTWQKRLSMQALMHAFWQTITVYFSILL